MSNNQASFFDKRVPAKKQRILAPVSIEVEIQRMLEKPPGYQKLVVLAFSEVVGTTLLSTKKSKGVEIEHTTLKCMLKKSSGEIC
jgi:hypothetical protein